MIFKGVFVYLLYVPSTSIANALDTYYTIVFLFIIKKSIVAISTEKIISNNFKREKKVEIIYSIFQVESEMIHFFLIFCYFEKIIHRQNLILVMFYVENNITV